MEKHPHLFHAQAHAAQWLDDLMQLVARFPEQNVEADLGAMTQAELWALYLHLRRLADQQYLISGCNKHRLF